MFSFDAFEVVTLMVSVITVQGASAELYLTASHESDTRSNSSVQFRTILFPSQSLLVGVILSTSFNFLDTNLRSELGRDGDNVIFVLSHSFHLEIKNIRKLYKDFLEDTVVFNRGFFAKP